MIEEYLSIGYFKFIVVLIAAFNSNNINVEDSLSALMQRMKSDKAVKIAYQEIRELELMDYPWHGSGYIYSLPPDLMIKEQLKPERVLMGVNGNKMYYLDTANKIRHQEEIEEDNPLTLNIAVFKALINADEALLRNLYKIDFSSNIKRWMMTLTPKKNPDPGLSIVVSGIANQQVDMIRIDQGEGDLSEFLLNKSDIGEEVNETVRKLFLDLKGR